MKSRILLFVLSIVFTFNSAATVKPTINQMVSYSSLVIVASVVNHEAPYVNYAKLTLQVDEVLGGEWDGTPLVIEMIDHTPIGKGVHDFVGMAADKSPRIFFLKKEGSAYVLSDYWFGIEPLSDKAKTSIKRAYSL